MTTTVARGAGRPAATARRNRHSQRTPLPPRAGDVQDAKDVIAAAAFKQAATIANVGRTNGKTSVSPGPNFEAHYAKAERFNAAIHPHGWESEIVPVGDQVTARAMRGHETITIRWDAGVFNYEESGYAIRDRVVRVRNVSQARQIASRPAESANAELTRVAKNRVWGAKKPAPGGPPKSKGLRFDPMTATEDELWQYLQGRAVKWHNRYRESEERALVSPNGERSFRLVGEGADRAVQFTATEGGFRAFRLSALISVGGSTRRTRKPKAE